MTKGDAITALVAGVVCAGFGPPLLTAADHRGLLRADDTAAAWSGGVDRRHLPALAGGVIAAVIGGVMVSRAVEDRQPVAEAVTYTSAVEAPATIPTTTTSTTTTTTTSVPSDDSGNSGSSGKSDNSGSSDSSSGD